MVDEDAAIAAVAVASDDTADDEDIARRHELPVCAVFLDRTVAGVPVIAAAAAAAAAAARGWDDDEVGTIVGLKLEAKQETKFRG